MTSKINALGMLLFIMASLFSITTNAEHQVFQSDTLSKIESYYQGKPFLMIVWSIECAPCRGELELVSEIKKQHQNINLAFVSTDGIEQSKQLNEILLSYDIKQPAWAFSKPSSQRLRYAIDAQWYGEMPRSYFYNAAHQRKGVSGKLTREMITKWINVVN